MKLEQAPQGIFAPLMVHTTCLVIDLAQVVHRQASAAVTTVPRPLSAAGGLGSPRPQLPISEHEVAVSWAVTTPGIVALCGVGCRSD